MVFSLCTLIILNVLTVSVTLSIVAIICDFKTLRINPIIYLKLNDKKQCNNKCTCKKDHPTESTTLFNSLAKMSPLISWALSRTTWFTTHRHTNKNVTLMVFFWFSLVFQLFSNIRLENCPSRGNLFSFYKEGKQHWFQKSNFSSDAESLNNYGLLKIYHQFNIFHTFKF